MPDSTSRLLPKIQLGLSLDSTYPKFLNKPLSLDLTGLELAGTVLSNWSRHSQIISPCPNCPGCHSQAIRPVSARPELCSKSVSLDLADPKLCKKHLSLDPTGLEVCNKGPILHPTGQELYRKGTILGPTDTASRTGPDVCSWALSPDPTHTYPTNTELIQIQRSSYPRSNQSSSQQDSLDKVSSQVQVVKMQ